MIMEQEFYRIRRLPPYVFEVVNRAMVKARSEGQDVIDFGMGNPDLPTPSHITQKLVESAQAPRTNRYSSSQGVAGLRRAQSAYYARRFGVELDPDSEVVVTLGSKEGLANLAQAMTSPGDVILCPNPTYPIHTFGFLVSGATIRTVPVTPGEPFLKALHLALRFSIPKPTAVILCYPSNPTGEVASLDFYTEVVKLARQNELFVISDLAYAEIYFEQAPPSLLQVKGARDVAIEFTSLSKSYSMPGWRVGFAVGNKRLIQALKRVKSYLDYGAFTPIQVAATKALNGPVEAVETIRNTYRRRRDVLVESFTRAGWTIPTPPASMFAWAPIPEVFRSEGSLAFAERMIRDASIVVSPGVGFGEHGEGYARIALVENEQRIRQAARNLHRVLGGVS